LKCDKRNANDLGQFLTYLLLQSSVSINGKINPSINQSIKEFFGGPK